MSKKTLLNTPFSRTGELGRWMAILGSAGTVQVRCCGKHHELRVDKNLNLHPTAHDGGLDGLRMLKTFGAEKSMRCLEVIELWNTLLSPACMDWQRRDLKKKLPKVLRHLHDHFYDAGQLSHTVKQARSYGARDLRSVERKARRPLDQRLIARREIELQNHFVAAQHTELLKWFHENTASLVQWYRTVFSGGFTRVFDRREYHAWITWPNCEAVSVRSKLRPLPILSVAQDHFGSAFCLTGKDYVNHVENITYWNDTTVVSVEPFTCPKLGKIFLAEVS